MKTVKTVNGFRKIEDKDVSLIAIQLRSILQEHRSTLIMKLMGGIGDYISYKFSRKAEPKKIAEINTKLTELSNSGIDIHRYQPIFDSVASNDFTSLDNTIFYSEIDNVIKADLFQPELFSQRHSAYLTDMEK